MPISGLADAPRAWMTEAPLRAHSVVRISTGSPIAVHNQRSTRALERRSAAFPLCQLSLSLREQDDLRNDSNACNEQEDID